MRRVPQAGCKEKERACRGQAYREALGRDDSRVSQGAVVHPKLGCIVLTEKLLVDLRERRFVVLSQGRK